MSVDLATLSVRLENTQALAAARQTGQEFDVMGAKGVAATRNITLAATPFEQAMLRSARATQAASGMVEGFESNAIAGAVAVTKATKATEEHSLSLGRVSRSLEMFSARAVGANEQVALLGTAMAHMKFGEEEVVAGLAGVAAAIFVWDAWTEKTRAARTEQEKLTKSLEEWLDKKDEFERSLTAEKSKVGEIGTTIASARGENGLFAGMRARMSLLSSNAMIRIASVAGVESVTGLQGMTNMFANKEQSDAQLAAFQQQHKGNLALSAGRTKVTEDADKKALEEATKIADEAMRQYEIYKKAADERDRIVESALKELQIARDRRALDEAGIGTKNQLSVRQRFEANLEGGMDPRIAAAIRATEQTGAALKDRADINKLGSDTIEAGIKRLGSRTANLTVSASPAPLPQLSAMEKALSEGFKDVSLAIGETLANKLVSSIVGGGQGAQFGGNLGNQLGGRLGTGLIDKSSSLLASVVLPVAGGILGTLTGGLLGGLFDHRRHIDENTAAIRQLTASITNSPAGFKADPYRNSATAVDPNDAVRWFSNAVRDSSARGGSTLSLAGA